MKNCLVIIVLLVFVAVGCKLPASLTKTDTNTSQTKTETNTNEASGQKAGDSGPWKGAPFKPSGNARDDVINSSNRFMKQKAFQAEMNGTGGKGLHMKLEYIAPDRYHITNSTTRESILINKETYVKTGGSWRKMQMDLAGSIANMREAFTEEGLKRLTDVEYAGEDTVNGKSAYIYSYKGSTGIASNTYTSKLWVGKDDGLPMKIDVIYSGGILN